MCEKKISKIGFKLVCIADETIFWVVKPICQTAYRVYIAMKVLIFIEFCVH